MRLQKIEHLQTPRYVHWATCVTVVRHSRQRGKASRTLRTRVRRTEEGKRGRRRRRRGRGEERKGRGRGGAGMCMCTRVGSGHTRCSRKCPELLELPTELKPARETESNEWSDHGEFPQNYPRVMNLRGRAGLVTPDRALNRIRRAPRCLELRQ